MIGSFASGTNVSVVAKNGTKQIIPLLAIKSSPVDKEASNQKVSENRPPKSWNYDSKYNLKIFKTKNQTIKRPPIASQHQKHTEESLK